MNTIRIKCPVCGAILNAKDDPSNVKKSVTCPNCKERRKFTEFKVIVPVAPAPVEAGQEPVADETQVCVRRRLELSPGYLLDKATGRSYPISAGEHVVGRKTSKSPSKADIAIETTDRGMSRLHLKLLCSLAQDGRYVYRSRCTALNDRFALVEYGSAICLGIDLETGKAYAVNGLSGIYPALCENRVLCSEGFLDLATGEVSIPEEPEGWTGEDETMKDLEIAAASRVLMLPGELRFLGVYYTAWERTENDMLRTEYLILRDLNGHLLTVIKMQGDWTIATYGRGEVWLVDSHLEHYELVEY